MRNVRKNFQELFHFKTDSNHALQNIINYSKYVNNIYCRGVARTLSNIYNGAFYKIVNDFKSLARTPENIEAEELSENS